MTDRTPLFNLKAVIHETGLGPATLRAWERRYGLLKPQRTAGGHRLYSEEDIEMLRWMVRRQEEGLSISRAIEMWRSLKENAQDPLQEGHTISRLFEAGGAELEKLRSEWIAACLVFDEQAAELVVGQALAIAAPEVVCTEVLQKGLAEIGDGWYTGSVSVQQEHFTSALAMRRLNMLLAAAAAPIRSERILAACPPGEQHDFVLLLLTFLLRRRGWEVVYLGADVPISRLGSVIQFIAPRLILAVAQTLNSAASLRQMANYAKDYHVPVAYGGGIFNHIPALKERIGGHFLGNDLAVVPLVVEHLFLKQPPMPEMLPVSPDYKELLEGFAAKEALIVASVTAALQGGQIEPAHLEVANSNFTRAIMSALILGDINFLEHSMDWLVGLLENHGLSPSLAVEYYAAYRRAVQQQLGNQAAPILDWLSQFDQAK
jgi:MerR family transcriptional regulator, light-induced transcriptional regulator